LVVSAAGALIAIYWLDLGQVGFFVAVAAGFCAYAALATGATLRVKEPAATQQPFKVIGSGTFERVDALTNASRGMTAFGPSQGKGWRCAR
jgi:hypothetical protein